MSTFQRDVAVTNSAFGGMTADQTFRTWVSAVSDAMLGAGLVKHTDTGQIDKTTVLAPVSSGQSRGYEIWRFNDALQATKPVFIKIEYGSGNNLLSIPGIYLTVGSATDGAGNITNLSTSRQAVFFQTNTNSTAQAPVLGGGDGSSVVQAVMRGVSGSAPEWHWFFAIERSRNADGTANGDGVMVTICSLGGSGTTTQFISFTNSNVSGVQSYQPIPFPGTRVSTANSGTSVTLFPAVVVTPKAQGQSLAVLGCGVNDFVRGSIVTAFVGGATHTYYAVTGTNPARSIDGGNVGILMRWE